jgi:hypothetical protein
MAARSILDSDMATLWRWLRMGFAWWVDELRGLMPRLFGRKEQSFVNFASYHGPGQIEITGRGKVLPVLVDPALCMVRSLQLPALSEADLWQLVQLDAERLFPLPASQMVIAAQAWTQDRTKVLVAGLPRDQAAVMLKSLGEAGIEGEPIVLGDPERPGSAQLDFRRALAEAGLIKPKQPVAAVWWGVAGFLFVFNVGLLVLRDVQQLERFEGAIAEQAPAVRAARIITSRIANTGQQAQLLAERRNRQNAAAILGAVTEALPAQAWVQRYSWEGRTIRISGYKRQGVDVIGALRASRWFTDVRAANAEAFAEVPSGQPFDVTATVRAGA